MKMKSSIVLSTFLLLMSSSVLHAAEETHEKMAVATHSEKKPTQIKKGTLQNKKNEKDAWKKLIWSQKNGELVVTNTGKEVIHLQPDINLLPDNMPVILGKTDIQPGESFIIHGVCKHHLPLQTQVAISLMSSGDEKIENHTVPILK
ncbi:TPA: hypothetical protein ACG0BA_004768 [Serratia odorifera]